MQSKLKFITTVLCISVMSLTACGNDADTVSKNDAVTESAQKDTDIEMGEDILFEWKELGYMDNYPEFRAVFDEILGNAVTESPAYKGGKCGPCYVDMDNFWTNNSTLRYAFNIDNFKTNFWENETALETVNNAVKEIYADVETDSEARLASINAYYNIFNTPDGYFNGNDTLTRAEFLTGVYKAHNPVNMLEANAELPTDVFNPFVNQMLSYSYLDLKGNTQAYGGVITRGEAIYTLVQVYYADLLGAYDADFPTAYTDAKCLEVKATDSKSTELNEALQNPDNGMPVELYKALLVANATGMIDGAESRWDEGITKAEALDMITRIYADKEFTNPVEFEINENSGGAAGSNLGIEDTDTEETTDQTQDSKVDHVRVDEDGQVSCSVTLKQKIVTALEKAGVDTKYTNTIVYEYYGETIGKDNTVIYDDIINDLVEDLADGLKQAEQEKDNNNNNNDNSNQNQNNNTPQDEGNNGGGGSSGEDDPNDDEPANWEDETPPSDDPFAGDFEFDDDDFDDGGEKITDGDVTMPSDDPWGEDPNAGAGDAPLDFDVPDDPTGGEKITDGDVTMPSDDPWGEDPNAGAGDAPLDFDDLGDGGDLITDGEVTIPSDDPLPGETTIDLDKNDEEAGDGGEEGDYDDVIIQ